MNNHFTHGGASIGVEGADAAFSQDAALRRSGLDAVGLLPWGTHFCQFYSTRQDLIDTLVPYFREGLSANEFCMWVASAPLEVNEAMVALRTVVPDLDNRIACGQIEFLDYSQWYTLGGAFDADRVLQAWADKLAEATRRGFDGLRLTGNTFWLEKANWLDFKHYEDTVHSIIGAHRILALCTYSAEKCGLKEILETVANHEFALVKQSGRWELIRSVEHQAELALRESRERLALFAQVTFEGIVISEKGSVVDCNEQFGKLLGYGVQELKGMSTRQLVAPEDHSRIFDNLLPGHGYHFELAMVRKDGSRLFVEARCKSDVSVKQRYTVVRDITERVLAEARAKETRFSLERERNLLQSVMNGARNAHLVFLDRDFNFVRVNETYASTCGYTPEQMIGKNHFDLYPHAENEAIFAQVRDSGKPVEFHDKPFIFPDQPERGVTYWDWTLIPVLGISRKTVGLVFSLVETTGRKLVEEALKKSEERFRAMVEAVPSLTFESNGEGLNTFVSESWCTYTGMSAAETRGWGWVNAVHFEDRDESASRWSNAAQNGTLYDSKHRLRGADGTYRWFIARALPTIGADGCIDRWAGSLTDIDDLVRAQQSLEQADRRKNEFLAMLSHELRNPLVPIRNAAHVLGHIETQDSRIKWAQTTIEGQVTHLTRLVDDLLDVSRIVRGKINLQREDFEFNAFAQRVLEVARPLIEGRGFELVVRLPDAPVFLNGDPVRLSQVLLNLLDNAGKFTLEGGTIVFRSRVLGDQIEIQVCDNGVGIHADLLPHVFEMFQQGERTLDRTQGGLGIGLTLVRRLVEMHGGKADARSDGQDCGATFTVRLPILPQSARTATQPDPVLRHAGNTRVLVIDNDPAVADSTAVLLEVEGHEVKIASSGIAALNLISVFQPRVVLLDIGLEGMDGFEVARRIRRLKEGRETCLISLTGYGDEDTMSASFGAGCDHHLVKPVNIDTLLSMLSSVS